MISAIKRLMSGNRRRYPRVRTTLEVALRMPDHPETPQVVHTRNLSASGMEILLDHPVDILSEIDVEIRIPEQDKVVQIRGQMVRSLPIRTLWDRLRNQEKRYVVGINFQDLDPAMRSQIIQTLRQITN